MQPSQEGVATEKYGRDHATTASAIRVDAANRTWFARQKFIDAIFTVNFRKRSDSGHSYSTNENF